MRNTLSGLATPIGIIGGMGPHAHLDFEKYLLGTAEHDQDYPSYVLVNASYVADRTTAYHATKAGQLLSQADNPLYGLRGAVITLLRAGCQKICMVCNTAHLWLSHLKEEFPYVEFISIIDTSVQALKKLGAEEVILLATEGTIRSGLYSNALSAAGIVTHIPSIEYQIAINEGIYGDPSQHIGGVKTGDIQAANTRFTRVAYAMLNEIAQRKHKSVQEVIASKRVYLGFFCTEIGVAIDDPTLRAIAVDSTEVLAAAMRQLALENKES
ncbi:aspartate/glutamate racemase family protein [Parvibium lacunae]|uniref:Aspartate/glutamate racemase family protein n=1 Tax=Parvibium lacunae TaxID=1888893 RepID=A0A368L4D0_9BURK|nr:amino acid racemase [Parvibium lacunae]RCS58438.1 aspartate/glutamate racemase family protein [Parvibium lacunae]